MTTAVLWLSPDTAAPSGKTQILWSQFRMSTGDERLVVSLPELVESNSEFWRKKYLTWLDSIGHRDNNGKTVIESLRIRPGLSYWWMTVPSEFSLDPDSFAYAVIRLWALDDVAVRMGISVLEVEGATLAMRDTLSLWSSSKSIEVKFLNVLRVSPKSARMTRLRKIFKSLIPAAVRGVLFLTKTYLDYLSLRRPKLKERLPKDLIVVDYLAHFDLGAALKSRYESHYWGQLASRDDYLGGNTDWIHIDVRTSGSGSPRQSRSVIRALNKGKSEGYHFLAQSFFSLSVFVRSLATFARIRKLRPYVDITWSEPQSQIDAGPLVESVLINDFRGTAAAANAFWLCLFERIFLPAQRDRKMIWLWENQSWELAALQARNSVQSSTNVGVAHLPVRFWDLRFFIGYSEITGPNRRDKFLPQPDIEAVPDLNSRLQLDIPALDPKTVTDVEALRFISHAKFEKKKFRASEWGSQARIVVLGEMNNTMAQRQAEMVKNLVLQSGDEFLISFRPHPVAASGGPPLPPSVKISNHVLARDDYNSCEAVLCSSVTAASLEAYLSGVLVMIHRDGRGFIGTPLTPGPRVAWVDGPDDVINAMRQYRKVAQTGSSGQPIGINLSRRFTLWNSLMSSLRNSNI